jgi:hypothetical protein
VLIARAVIELIALAAAAFPQRWIGIFQPGSVRAASRRRISAPRRAPFRIRFRAIAEEQRRTELDPNGERFNDAELKNKVNANATWK